MSASLSFYSTGIFINSTHDGGCKYNFRFREGAHIMRMKEEDF